MTRLTLKLLAVSRRVSALEGWRRLGAAFAAGVLAALSTAPFGLWPVLAISFPVLVLLLDGTRTATRHPWRIAAAIGWWFGFGYFLSSLWWIGDAFLVEADVFAWLLPVAVVCLPAGLALFPALGLLAARMLWSRGPARLCALAAGLGGAEWLRGHVLTGFPWNTFGYALAENLAFAQTAALVGIAGLTFLTILLLSAPVLLLSAPTRPHHLVSLTLAVLSLVAMYAGGAIRLARTDVGMVPGVNLRILQPALAQDEKFAYGRREAILDDYLTLSAQPSARYPGGLTDVSLLIWPESAFPFLYEREPWAARRIAESLPRNVVLVTGAARYGVPPEGQISPYFNSIRVIAADGTVLQSADKVHLVPFGEYLPFQAFLERIGLEQLTRVRGGFSSGAQLQALHIPGAPLAGPLICYEAIFSGAVIPPGPRPGFLLNVTNDAWFGDTPGPHQHFLQARLRAIEEGLPLVRSANTGISGIIDPLGRIVADLGLDKRGVVDGYLPQRLENPPPAARIGGSIVLIMFLLLFALGALGADSLRCIRAARKS
ncbi:apolipoprotein N-acyltransferase [Xanthobacter sp. DSM 24535]|uniref:apolipoprotein N-acyltransferase n=1 Tax=Roseixanthobacter psychrophilus TaxID=3119917 RepID=UPI0037265252